MSGTTHYAVLTAIGADRPGLVDEVTAFILRCGGNLEESRLVNLHGQFAMMLLVTGDAAAMDGLREGLDELARDSGVHAQLTPADQGGSAVAARLPYRLTTTAMDHPGLVQSVAHALRALDVNIESAETTLAHAPVTGAPVFAMELVVSVPAGLAVAELREAVGEVCDTLNMDWQLAAL